MFWRVDELASAIVLTPAAFDGLGPSISLSDLPHDSVLRDAEDGVYVLVRDDATDHQLLLIGQPTDTTPLGALIPLDGAAPHRADAALRFWRLLAHGQPRKPRRLLGRRDRLIEALRALDGRLSGASYRMIAEGLFDRRRVRSEPWKTASLRDTVIRLVRTGYRMMIRDYRRLLGPRRHD